MTKGEYVEVTVRLDKTTIKALGLNITMKMDPVEHQLLLPYGDVLHSLGLAIWMEARGAYPEQIHKQMPMGWRNIEIVPNTRRVLDGELNPISDERPPSEPDKEREPGRDEGPCTHPDNPTGGCNPECNYFEHETNETEGGDCQWHNKPDVDVFWVCMACSEILGKWTEIKKAPICQKCGTASTLDERSMPTQEDDPVEHKLHSDHDNSIEDTDVYPGGE